MEEKSEKVMDEKTAAETYRIPDMNKPIDQTVTEKSLFQVGEKYFIRTVTSYLLGKVKKIGNKQLLLSTSSWVAMTGRFAKCITAGQIDEIEYIGADVIVNEDSIVDAYVWIHPLPRETK